MKKHNNPLVLTIIATTLISGVAIVWAWTGPTGSPLSNNVAAPLNSGSIAQTKSSSLTTAGLGSTGVNIFTGNTRIGGATAPTQALDVTGNAVISGNVGIKRTSPLTTLDINGDFRARYGELAGSGSYLGFNTFWDGSSWRYRDTNFAAALRTYNGGFQFLTAPSGTAGAVPSFTETVTFLQNGNVGIGTNGPGTKLQVSVAPNSVDGAVVSATDGRSIRVAPSTGTGSWNAMVQAGDQSLIFSNGTPGTGNLVIAPWTAAANAGLRITNTGAVGVGTTTPASTLGVQGAITAAGTIRSSTGGFQFPDGTTQSTAAGAGQWTTSGANIYSSNSGNVGINIANPTAKLHVVGSAGITALYVNGAGSANLYIDNVGSGSNYLRGNTFFNGILYDETNYTYYLDPSGTSAFNTATFNNLRWGNSYSRTETRDNAGLQGNAGALSGFFQASTPVNYYAGASSWQHMIESRHSNETNNYALQIAGSFYDQDLYFRKTNNNPTQAWSKVVAVNPAGNVNLLGNLSIGTGGVTLAPSLAVNGSGLIGGANQTYDIGAGSIAAGDSIYSYDKICAGNSAGNCEGTGGMVMSTTNLKFPDGTTQTTAAGAGQWTTSGTNIYSSNSGNVGIGVNPTLAKLQVVGNTLIQSGTGDTWLGGWLGGVENYLRGNTFFSGILYDEDNSGYYVNPASTSIYNDLRANIFYDNNNTGFVLDPSGSSNISYLAADRMVITSGDPYLSTNTDSKHMVLSGGSGWANTGAVIVLRGSGAANNTHGMELYAGNAERMRILANGNVGIGNSAPSQKLDVAGTIRSTAGGFIFPDGTTQSTAAASITNAVRTGVAGDWYIASNVVDASYANAALEIRESNFGLAGTGADSEAPRISFHWGNRHAKQIGLNSAGNIRTYDALGTSYAGFEAGNISANGTLNVNGPIGNTHFNYGGTANYIRGNTFFNGILYDEGNTAFYLDPTGTSNFYDLRSDFIYDRNDTNYYIDLNNVSYFNDLRPNVIYDRNNAGYYLDPNGSSNLATVSMGTAYSSNWFRSYGATGWYSEAYGSGIYADEAGFVRGYGGSGLKMYGNIFAPAFIYNSDERLKENITPLQNSLAKVRALEGYSFNWKEGGRADIGLVAQQVETVFPDIVHTDSKTNLKSVEYGNLVAPLIEAVKELAQMFESLAVRVFNTEVRQTELEKQNALQAQQIAELQRQITELSTKK